MMIIMIIHLLTMIITYDDNHNCITNNDNSHTNTSNNTSNNIVNLIMIIMIIIITDGAEAGTI